MINPDFSEWTEVSLKEVSRNEEIPLNGKKKIETSKELGHLLKIRVQEIKWGLKTSWEKYSHRQWHPTPVLLPGKSHGRRSLVGYSPWGR